MPWKQHSNREEFLKSNLKDLCPGKRVLDFCCGSGMNGIDALRWGASHVTFTDVRRETFENYISDKENSKVLSKDNHVWRYADANYIQYCRETIDLKNLDIIIYHGHFYHARNHIEIIRMFAESNAEYIIFETKGEHVEHSTIYWHSENTNSIWNTIGDSVTELVGAPSTGACKLFFDYYGFAGVADEKQDWRCKEHDEAITQVRTLYKRKG